MTEAGELWIAQNEETGDAWRLLNVQILSAEHWLRAFIAEVYKRLDQPPYFGPDDHDGLAEVFTELTRDLLGDPPRSAA
jgi:hypothetical protein